MNLWLPPAESKSGRSDDDLGSEVFEALTRLPLVSSGKRLLHPWLVSSVVLTIHGVDAKCRDPEYKRRLDLGVNLKRNP